MTNETRNGILVTIGVLVGGYLLYNFIKKRNPNTNPTDPTNPTDDPTNPTDPTDPPPPNPSTPDLTGNQVMQIANDLFEAMDDYMTNEDTISTAFGKIKTNNDFDNLVSAFGTRTLNCGTGNPFCSDFTGNLIECLRDELDEDEISEVNDILRRNSVSRTI